MGKKQGKNRRSDCPISIGLDLFGDRWTLLILRDLLLKGRSTFKEFQASEEGIASNILTDRLHRLTADGLITSNPSKTDARKITYQPTPKALDLLPVMLEIVLWSARHEKTAAPEKTIQLLKTDRDSFIARIRSQFEQESTQQQN